MAKTGKTTKETTANLGFEAELSSISIFGQERNATTHHLASQGMTVFVFANRPAVPRSSNHSGSWKFVARTRNKKPLQAENT